MHPVLFEIPGLGFPIRSFGVMVAGGILLAIWAWGKLLARYGDDPVGDPLRGSQVALWAVIGVLVGARLMYVTVESSRYLAADVTPSMRSYLEAADRGQAGLELSTRGEGEAVEAARRVSVGHDFLSDPLRILFIWQGGLVMYGGFLGGVIFGAYSARKHGLKVWNALDTALVCSFLGLMVGRVGCLLVGDDYGAVVTRPEAYARPLSLPGGAEIGPLTVRVPDLDWLLANPESLFDHDLAGQVLWASQPWMSVNALLIALAGLWLLKRRSWNGQVVAWILVHYSITRFLIERFRGDEIRGLWFGGALSTSQLISIVGLTLGIFLWVKRPGPPTVAPREPQPAP